jgi:LPPG:FO 2-phospho-L-lactate transferase
VGLAPVVGDGLCCVVNTADDLDHLGLHVSPDLDSVSYALAGRFDEERGFGLAGDSFACVEALARFGAGWFRIGDEDLALHLRRTELLRAGARLSQATATLAPALGLPGGVTLLPMSDDRVRTVVTTAEGRLSFQDYLVVRRAQPQVIGVEHEGAAQARPAPGVLEALGEAELVVIGPSNPVQSIGPILAVPGVRHALAGRARPTVAVTPVVSGQAPATAAEQARARVRAAFLGALGLPHTATEVARLYQDLLDGFVLDHRDIAEQPAIEALGVAVLLADTLAPPAERPALAGAVLGFASGLSRARRGPG